MAGIVSLIRRICLLREQGEAGRAKRVQEDELAEALRAWRAADGPDAWSDSIVAELFAREEERIADAQVLAELLAPRLNAGARPAAVPSRPLPTTMAAAGDALAPDPLSIPTLLDAMLAAERTSPRTRR